MEHAVRGSSGATELLYRRHAPRVFRYCSRCLRRRPDAEDALQQTFLQAHRALERGAEPVSEIAWLLTIARNVCLTRADTLRRRDRFETPEDPDVLADLAPAMTAEEGISPEVQAAFARLSDRQRQALFLREWESCSYAEIAARLGTTEAAVETLVFRARRSLAKELAASRRRVPSLAGLLGWLRSGLASTASKVTAGALAATVAAGTAVTVEQGPKPPPPHARNHAAATSAAAVPARSASIGRLAGRGLEAAPRHRAARPSPQASAPPPPGTAAPSPSAGSTSAPPPPASSSPNAQPSTQSTVATTAEAAAPGAGSAVAGALSATATTVDAVTQVVGNTVPAVAPVTNTVAASAVDTTHAAVTTVTSGVSNLLPGN